MSLRPWPLGIKKTMMLEIVLKTLLIYCALNVTHSRLQSDRSQSRVRNSPTKGQRTKGERELGDNERGQSQWEVNESIRREQFQKQGERHWEWAESWPEQRQRRWAVRVFEARRPAGAWPVWVRADDWPGPLRRC